MATGSLSPDPWLTFVDANGVPLSGGLVYTYSAGTTTPIATYTDVGLTTPNANPIVLDSAGRCTIFLTPGTSYKFAVQTSAAVSVRTADNILGLPLSTTTVTGGTLGQVLTSTGPSTPASFQDLPAAFSPVTITTTGTQTALALPAGYGALTIVCNNATLLTLQGIVAGLDGQPLTLISKGAGQVDLVHQSGSATAANRLINIATSANTSLAAGSGIAVFVYDATTARWRLISHEQGAWITPTFAAGDYTGNGSMTVTVGSGDVTTCAYKLSGREIKILLRLDSITIAGTPDTTIQRVIPGGFTATKLITNVFWYSDNAGTFTTGFQFVSAGGTVLGYRPASGNWTAAADTTVIIGEFFCEVT